MKAQLIGLTGKAGSGKDSVKEALLARIQNSDAYSFATPLKQSVSKLFGWTQEQIEDREFKEAVDPKWGFTPRRAMQLFGTEFGRALKESLWLDFATIRFNENREAGYSTIISDVRFENEATWVRDNGGTLIHVIPVNKPTPDVVAHASEGGVARHPYDIVVYNDFSLGADYPKQLADLVIELLNNLDD